MTGEYNFYGLYFPWLLVCLFGALIVGWAGRKILAATGFYRWVWHPALFDFALFIVILYAVNQLSPLIFK